MKPALAGLVFLAACAAKLPTGPDNWKQVPCHVDRGHLATAIRWPDGTTLEQDSSRTVGTWRVSFPGWGVSVYQPFACTAGDPHAEAMKITPLVCENDRRREQCYVYVERHTDGSWACRLLSEGTPDIAIGVACPTEIHFD